MEDGLLQRKVLFSNLSVCLYVCKILYIISNDRKNKGFNYIVKGITMPACLGVWNSNA